MSTHKRAVIPFLYKPEHRSTVLTLAAILPVSLHKPTHRACS